jgi:phosphate transport system permease protein
MKKIFGSGDAFIWLTGGALGVSLLMVIGLVALIMVNGLGFFWPKAVYEFTTDDGRTVIGQITAREIIPQPDAPPGTPESHRIQVRQGNRDLYGADFVWMDEDNIAQSNAWPDLVVIERASWGNFYGYLDSVSTGKGVSAKGPDAWEVLQEQLPRAHAINEQIRALERGPIGRVNRQQERHRLELRQLAKKGIASGPEAERLKQEMSELQAEYATLTKELMALRAKKTATAELRSADGRLVSISVGDIVHAYRPNAMSVAGKAGHYAGKVWEFVSEEPRESNTEGGVFPAIFGTVMMVMIMSVIVTPLGVIAAFFLREYAKQGPLVSAVRIAVNNLAGVPSIVFGVFGVGFFIYFVGNAIDRAFYAEALPTPTFGTGGILWASLTLALLTVPVVIVATEEGLAAIPNSVREGSLALGATKFETMWRVVLPAVMPSVLTGLILAMARAAGEVAPLMITGVVKLAPTLPVDGTWPFFHLERKFMHLGFHIYDVGFQSPNVDAARPMVYTTTILLLLIVLVLNLAAIQIRARLRKKYSVTTL